MLIVDPWHWLEPDGSLPEDNPRLRRQVLRVARIIEYGAPLPKGESRETLIECPKRPGGHPCGGLLWVAKNRDDSLSAFCLDCETEQVLVHNWQGTQWAE